MSEPDPPFFKTVMFVGGCAVAIMVLFAIVHSCAGPVGP